MEPTRVAPSGTYNQSPPGEYAPTFDEDTFAADSGNVYITEQINVNEDRRRREHRIREHHHERVAARRE
jgi:hypothetical protein